MRLPESLTLGQTIVKVASNRDLNRVRKIQPFRTPALAWAQSVINKSQVADNASKDLLN